MAGGFGPKTAARHRAKMAVVGAAALASLLGALVPARAAAVTTLQDCLRSGGHESGKYCSGGGQDGKLINY